VAHEQFSFARVAADECVVTVVNSSALPARVAITLPTLNTSTFINAFDPTKVYSRQQDGRCEVDLPKNSFVLLKTP
jgi:hypothetical protein